MIDELIQRVKFPLANTVEGSVDVDADMLVSAWCLQRHRIVSHLFGKERISGENSAEINKIQPDKQVQRNLTGNAHL